MTLMLLVKKGTTRAVPVYDAEGRETRTLELPAIFDFPVRKDLIRRVFLAEFTAALQPKGRDPMAGKRTSARSLGVGLGIARIPRVRRTLRGALINFAVGGRLAHPPRVEKVIVERINKKEKVLATISAVAATSKLELVRERGHVFSAPIVPVVIEDEVENEVKRAREARELLEKLGVYQDVERSKERTRIRAGKGKMRGRRYIEPRSVLFVLNSHRSPLALSVRNFSGVDIVTPEVLSVLYLAPGGVPGRLTVYTISAIESLWRRFERKIAQLISIGQG